MSENINYSYQTYANAQAEVLVPGKNPLAMLLLVLIGFSAFAFGLMIWLSHHFPTETRSLLITLDQFGITEIGAKEQRRRHDIERLPIPYEQKQVLISHTIFFGASRVMTMYSLGDPVCVTATKATKDQPAAEYWVYYIGDDRKPTQLIFVNDSLVSAAKSSALDTCQQGH